MARDLRRPILLLVVTALLLSLIGGGYYFGLLPSIGDPVPVPLAAGEALDSTELAQDAELPTEGSSDRETIGVDPSTKTAAEPSGRQVNLLVLNAATREPVANAEVHYTDPEFNPRNFEVQEQLRLENMRSQDPEQFLRKYGIAIETDPEGRCLIPAEQGYLRLCARKDQLFGSTEIDHDQGTDRVLLLYTSENVDLRVLDYLGRPAARVEITAYPSADASLSTKKTIGESDADGRFTILNVHSLVEDLASDSLVVAASPPGGESNRLIIDPDMLPGEESVITLPPTGSWTIGVNDASGQRLNISHMASPLLWLYPAGQKPPWWLRMIETEGSTHFEHVVLDQDFDLKVSQGYTEAGVSGPSKREPDLITEIRLPENTLFLHGRALDGRGEALTDDGMQCLYGRGSMGGGAVSLRSDQAGHFTVYLLGRDPEQGVQLNLRLWVDNDFDVELRQDLELPPGMNPGHHDLGDVEFSTGRILGSGRAVLASDEIPPPFHIALSAMVDGQPTYPLTTTTWPEPGVFEIRGLTSEERLRIQSGDVRYMSKTPIEFTAGASDLVLEVTQPGDLTASFLVQRSTPWNLYRYELQRRFEAERAHRPEASRLELEGDRVICNWRRLDPGLYDLLVHVPGQSQPLAAVRDIEVTGGEVRDPRLKGITLLPGMQQVQVRLHDPAGQTINVTGAGLILAGSMDPGSRSFVPAEDGVALVAIGQDLQALAIAPGYLSRTFRLTDRNQEITLDKGKGSSFLLRFPSPLPNDVHAQFTLTPAKANALYGARVVGYRTETRWAVGGFTHLGRRQPPPGHQELRLDGDGRAAVTLLHAGLYELRLRLFAGRSTATLPGDSLPDFEWDGVSTGTVTVDVPEAALREALTKLEK